MGERLEEVNFRSTEKGTKKLFLSVKDINLWDKML